MRDMEGKVAIVTGSATGVGSATARMLAGRGCNVVVNYTKSEEEARDNIAACEACGVETILCQADVSNDADCCRMVDAAVTKWGRIDALVNNAGTTKFCAIVDLNGLDKEDFLRIYSVNVVGPFQMARAVAPHMKKVGQGAIVNVASLAAMDGRGSSIAYAASKGALVTMTLSLAHALCPEIRVNAVCPGFIQGRWLKQGLGEPLYDAAKAHMEQSSLLRVTATPENVAEAVVYLVCGAEITTGETLTVDGGMRLR
ncbi:MAG: glucose 1-dehydrogenase [Chloroflexota bacterium]|nr:glucose 1-dehydrogenase [Chloroflexota bacterium]